MSPCWLKMQDQYKLVVVGLMIVWMWITDNGYGFDVDLKMEDQNRLAVFCDAVDIDAHRDVNVSIVVGLMFVWTIDLISN